MSERSKFVLTLAEPGSSVPRNWSAWNHRDAAIDGLDRCALARSERGEPIDLEDVHLSRCSGTDYVQWWGRTPDSQRRPVGRLMRMYRVYKSTRSYPCHRRPERWPEKISVTNS